MWRILPSSCSCLELADLVLQRVRRVDAVQLEEVDRLDAEPAQAELGTAGGGTAGSRAASRCPGPDG